MYINAPFAYTQFNFPGLMATGGTTNLKFVLPTFSGSFFRVDDVVVDPAATTVPESLSTLWLIAPVAGTLLSARLQRRKA